VAADRLVIEQGNPTHERKPTAIAEGSFGWHTGSDT
jgi:hypothetical protein